jgi:hypothetical protein
MSKQTPRSSKNGKSAKRESDAQKTERLGPAKKIVRWEVNPKKGATTEIAVLECGHHRAAPRAARLTVRCNQCRIEKATGAKILSRYAKLLKATGTKPVVAKAPVKTAKKAAKKAEKKAAKAAPKATPKKAAKKKSTKPAAPKAAPTPKREAVLDEPVERVAASA